MPAPDRIESAWSNLRRLKALNDDDFRQERTIERLLIECASGSVEFNRCKTVEHFKSTRIRLNLLQWDALRAPSATELFVDGGCMAIERFCWSQASWRVLHAEDNRIYQFQMPLDLKLRIGLTVHYVRTIRTRFFMKDWLRALRLRAEILYPTDKELLDRYDAFHEWAQRDCRIIRLTDWRVGHRFVARIERNLAFRRRPECVGAASESRNSQEDPDVWPKVVSPPREEPPPPTHFPTLGRSQPAPPQGSTLDLMYVFAIPLLIFILWLLLKN